MKKILLLLVTVMGGGLLWAQNNTQTTTGNTIAVLPGDDHATIINKAAHVVPTANQYHALENEFIAFIHFGPNTFTRMEWGTGKEDPRIFDLKELHTDQWCEAMKAAGIRMVILTVKHHDGFVLWQSRYTRHGIMSSGFEGGKGDILKNLVASCKKYGLKVGIYLSPADLYQIESPTGLYGNLSKYTKRTIPREVPGRPFSNKTTFSVEADDYNEYFMNQLFELLTEYGPVYEVWFDGAHPKTKGGQQYNYQAWKKIIHTLAPQAVIFGKEDIRWCGNESGSTRATEWNVLPFGDNPDSSTHFPDLQAADLGSRNQLYTAKYLHYQQAETNTSIREGWFYRDNSAQKVRSADDVFDIYERAVGGNSTFLLNIPPNRTGKFSPADVACLKETGKRIRETYGVNLFQGAKGPKETLDNNSNTFSTANTLVISTPAAVTINRLMIQEAVATQGERVESHALDAWVNGQWKEIATATNIGYKRILRFPEITSAKFRVRILQSRATPAISNITAHYYQPRPPRLQILRDKKGMVTITSQPETFNWKPHHENASENLNKGAAVYYTTNGATPGSSSMLYKSPFYVAQGNIKAIAIYKNEKGPVATLHAGIAKENWKLATLSSETGKHGGIQAFDGDEKTWWQSDTTDSARFITIDMGSLHRLTGFSYTPQQTNASGMMAKGIISVSTDNKTWQEAGRFTFGNLINDPVTRNYLFSKVQQARYVRIESTEQAGSSNIVSIAELDFFED